MIKLATTLVHVYTSVVANLMMCFDYIVVLFNEQIQSLGNYYIKAILLLYNNNKYLYMYIAHVDFYLLLLEGIPSGRYIIECIVCTLHNIKQNNLRTKAIMPIEFSFRIFHVEILLY